MPRGEGEFVTVRHIVIGGSNQAIGKKLAEIARERYGVRLAKNPDPIYGKARLSYMERNYPILFERMKGVAAAYGVDVADGGVDFSSLPYNFGPPTSCSMICFPGSATDTGHGLIVRSMDYSNGTLSAMLGQKPHPGEKDIFSEPYVMEVYPDKGYASLYMSCADLLSGAWDGINSEGLCVFGLVDLGRPKNTVVTSGTRVIGLHPPQIMRLVLDTCANVDEAKVAMLENRIYDVAQGIHYLVADRHGNSFIFEVNHLDQQAYITDNGGKPQVMTNSPVWALPSPEEVSQGVRGRVRQPVPIPGPRESPEWTRREVHLLVHGQGERKGLPQEGDPQPRRACHDPPAGLAGRVRPDPGGDEDTLLAQGRKHGRRGPCRARHERLVRFQPFQVRGCSTREERRPCGSISEAF